MTATDPFDASEENSGVGTVDEQAVLEYLRRYDGATIEGLINATGSTEGHIRTIIQNLKEAGQIRIQPRRHSVRLEPLTGVDADRTTSTASTDGGMLQRLGDQFFELAPAHGMIVQQRCESQIETGESPSALLSVPGPPNTRFDIAASVQEQAEGPSG